LRPEIGLVIKLLIFRYSFFGPSTTASPGARLQNLKLVGRDSAKRMSRHCDLEGEANAGSFKDKTATFSAPACPHLPDISIIEATRVWAFESMARCTSGRLAPESLDCYHPSGELCEGLGARRMVDVALGWKVSFSGL